jgi:hypothetical protein
MKYRQNMSFLTEFSLRTTILTHKFSTADSLSTINQISKIYRQVRSYKLLTLWSIKSIIHLKNLSRTLTHLTKIILTELHITTHHAKNTKTKHDHPGSTISIRTIPSQEAHVISRNLKHPGRLIRVSCPMSSVLSILFSFLAYRITLVRLR